MCWFGVKSDCIFWTFSFAKRSPPTKIYFKHFITFSGIFSNCVIASKITGTMLKIVTLIWKKSNKSKTYKFTLYLAIMSKKISRSNLLQTINLTPWISIIKAVIRPPAWKYGKILRQISSWFIFGKTCDNFTELNKVSSIELKGL